MREARSAALLAALILLGVARPSRAQSRDLAGYSAPPSCPDAAWFAAELERRLASTARRSPASSAEWDQLQVRVTEHPGGLRGQVWRVGPHSDGDVREVEHARCEALLEALALIGAVLLEEPRAAERSVPPAARPAAPRARKIPPPRRELTPTHAIQHGPWLGLGWEDLVSPNLRWGPRLGYTLRLRPVPGRTVNVRASVARIASGSLAVPNLGSAELTWTAGRLEACHHWSWTPASAVGPCAGIDLGQLSGEGRIQQDNSGARRAAFWASPLLALDFEWNPLRPLSIGAAVGVRVPLTRPEFHFSQAAGAAESVTIYEVPARAGLSSHFRLELRFP